MLSERTVTAILLGIAAAGLLAVTGYNLWIAPPAEGLTAIRVEDSSAETASFPELDLPVVPDTEHPLDLNAATAEELDRLPGIGEVLAGRIIQYRTANGPFQSLEELLNVEGIGEKIFSDICDRLEIHSIPSE